MWTPLSPGPGAGSVRTDSRRSISLLSLNNSHSAVESELGVSGAAGTSLLAQVDCAPRACWGRVCLACLEETEAALLQPVAACGDMGQVHQIS